MARVKIKKLPKALSGLEIKMQPGLYGTNGNRQFTLPNQVMSQKFAQQPTEVRSTLQPVPREEANLEAERGETAVVNVDGMPAHFKIGGKRHSQGGTPLNLPDNSFIFSDTAKMKIKDPNILAQFGMSIKEGGYTPADIAKKYDINAFRKILADANTEDVERKTAEMMISNYNDKLAKLSLAQESMKGFPQGVPVIAMPYIIANEVDPSTYLPTQGQQEQPDADTGEARYGGNMVAQFDTKAHGGMHFAGYPYYQNGGGIEAAVSYLREKEAQRAKEKKYRGFYNKALSEEYKKLETQKESEKLARLQESVKRANLQNLVKQEEKIKRLLGEAVAKKERMGVFNYTGSPEAKEAQIEKAIGDYTSMASRYGVPTKTISVSGPMYKSKAEQQAAPSTFKMSEGEKEYRKSKAPKTVEKAEEPAKEETDYTQIFNY
jgi:hypothetical protein